MKRKLWIALAVVAFDLYLLGRYLLDGLGRGIRDIQGESVHG